MHCLTPLRSQLATVGRFVIAVLLSAVAAPAVYSESGVVKENLSMKSEILNETRPYSVYLPPGYTSSDRCYPVLYLLHGHGDTHTSWIQFGEVQHIADEAIRNGRATPMVIVMPNADKTHRGYVNHITDDFRYEDFFITEFIPHVESEFRIRCEKRFRAVAGNSMGGNGSLVYALRHPDLFSCACPLSAYAGPIEADDLQDHVKWLNLADKVSDEQCQAFFDKYSILKLVEQMPDSQREAVRWYIDCGDDDFLYEANSLLHIAMRKQGVPHEFRIRNGGHAWSYWRAALPDVLAFVSTRFHK